MAIWCRRKTKYLDAKHWVGKRNLRVVTYHRRKHEESCIVRNLDGDGPCNSFHKFCGNIRCQPAWRVFFPASGLDQPMGILQWQYLGEPQQPAMPDGAFLL